MAYQSLYRKYRPQNFADVVGQSHVTRTLQNALASGRVAHGYLFTGTRGTAKTTVARLLAKALNCESSDRPVAEPCNQCGACKAITAGGSIDVIEMDAASHRGVADIEEVRKSVGYGPMELRYKVFIIDEAHQLSSDAKDAFLKTLEEPPPNVVFILATTEPQAIPITIRSRCQQFDFKRGSLQEISSRLRYVLDSEGVVHTPDAVNLIARGAEGSYRDALSLLEQVLAFSPASITSADVDAVLGTLDTESLGSVTEAIAQRDAPTTFSLAGQLLDSGKEARTLLKTLAGHFRDLMLVAVGGPAVAMELSPEEVGRLQAQARLFAPEQMMKAMDILNEAQGETRWNNQHRLLVELTFLKLMNLGEGAHGPLKTADIIFSPVAATPAPAAPAPVRPNQLPAATIVPLQPAPKAVPAAPVIETPTPRTPDPQPPARAIIAATPTTEELPAGFFADTEPADPDDDYQLEDALPVEGSLFGGTDNDDPSVPPVYGQTGYGYPLVGVGGSAPQSSPAPQQSAPPDTDDDDDPGPEDPGTDTGDDFFGGDPPFDPTPTEKPVAPSGTAAPLSREETNVAVLDTRTGVITPPAPEPETQPEDAFDGQLELFNINDVFRAWAHFLGGMQKVSKATQVVMGSAQPTNVDHGIIEIVLPSRFHFEQMTDPKKQEVVRKLLARCLGVDKVQIRFVLSPDVAPQAKPRTEKKKVEIRDPLAILEQLNHEPTGDEFGWNSAAPPPTRPPADARPVTTPPVFATSPSRPDPTRTPDPGPRTPNPIPTWHDPPPEPAEAKPPSEKVQAALDDPLVQEVLQIFGGTIVENT